ncbi:MAG: hypothetical protein Tsb002_25090 [Wenzhouxiangellaceae bacterium]
MNSNTHLTALLAFAGLILSITTVAQANPQAMHSSEEIRAGGTPELSCYVDTPAYDQFTPYFCSSIWFFGPNTTTAVFQVFNVNPASHSYNWSVNGCSGEQCFTTIGAYVPLTVSVTVTNNATGQQYNLSATAEYELGY